MNQLGYALCIRELLNKCVEKNLLREVCGRN